MGAGTARVADEGTLFGAQTPTEGEVVDVLDCGVGERGVLAGTFRGERHGMRKVAGYDGQSQSGGDLVPHLGNFNVTMRETLYSPLKGQ